MSDQKYISIREYARRIGCSHNAVYKAIKNGHISNKALKIDKNGRRRGINPDIADAEWSQTFDPNTARNPELLRHLMAKAAEGSKLTDRNRSKTVDSISKAKAQQVEAVYRAKLRELEYKEKAGILVNKDQVYKELFAVGRMLRSAMQSIPDRYIDEIIAAGSRNESHRILQEAIDDELQRLSELDEVTL